MNKHYQKGRKIIYPFALISESQFIGGCRMGMVEKRVPNRK